MNKKMSKKDIIYILLQVLLFFSVLRPYFFSGLMLEKICDALAIAALILVLPLYIFKNGITQFTLFFLIYRIVVLTSTIIHRGLVRDYIVETALILLPIIIIEYEGKHNLRRVIASLIIVLSVLLSINFLDLFIHPLGLDGGRRYWFMGFKNEIGKYFILFLALLKIYNRTTTKFIFWPFIIVGLYTTYYVDSANGIAGILITVIFIIIGDKFYNILNIYTYTIGEIVFFILAVLINNVGVLSYIISTVLNRNAFTFTGRTVIWSNAIVNISQNPLIGLGKLSYEQMVYHLGGRIGFSDCHNFYLNQLFYGGLICFAFFAFCYYVVIKSIHKNKEDPNNIILSSAILSFLIVFTFEGSPKPTFWILLALGYIYNMDITLANKSRQIE